MVNLRSKLWGIVTNLYPAYLRKIKHMDIGQNVLIAPLAHIDHTYTAGIHIGDRSIILKGAFILSHDSCRSLRADTFIGQDCVIGINSIILPGIHIGDNVVVGAGSIVSKDIPSNCIVAGNPEKKKKKGIVVKNGRITISQV